MLETVRTYGLERLAAAGEEPAVRAAFTAYFLNLAEVADPELRSARQRHWLRELIGEQDNMHAALRRAIASQDADTALRFVRALGWYWMLRGQPGEPEALAREVLVLEPREQSPRIAEARTVCALTAAGAGWDMEAVIPVLAAALADFAEWSPDAAPGHPIAAMGEPMLALHERNPERAFALFDRYATSPDPWVRAAQPLMRGTFGSMLGQLDQAESDCRESLAAFRAMNEAWGAAAVLVQLAEFAELRADFPGAIAALDEAAEQAQQLGAWGDLSHVNGKRAAIRLRMGDLAGARADLDRAEAEAAQRGGAGSDTVVWLGLVGIELHCREGDMAAARRQGEAVLTWLEGKRSAWWNGLAGLIKVRLALAFLACGDEVRGRLLLAEALDLAAEWVERPVLAAVFDAIAVLVQHPAQPERLPERLPDPREAAKLAATLLGAAHSLRGCFNEGSLDAPVARDAAGALLGEPAFHAAYARGRELSSDDALALANSAVAIAATAG
jgi:hypothetical protein